LVDAIDLMLPRLQGWLDELDSVDRRRADRADELQQVRLFYAHARRAMESLTTESEVEE
jgi:hypothetical protein